MTTDLLGTIRTVGEIEVISDKFKKRDIVITIDEDSQYPQVVSVQAVQDNCDKVDELRAGDKATLTCNIRGREHNGKFYVSLQLWKFAINQSANTSVDLNAKVETGDMPF